MSHIFRLYTDGADTYQDWHGSGAFPYGHGALEQIQDPEGDSAKIEITSIPSPFARIDIAKHAFGEVNRLGLDGDTIFHKTVSDILDVGEIFFNYEKFSSIIDIITWHPENMEIMQKQSEGNKLLGMAYETYMTSDHDTYNFDKNQNIYILNWKNGKHSLDVIGATSPATLFFSSANDLSELAKIISFGKDHPFDKDYNPLYNRDFDYVKAWFIMRQMIPQFSQKLPEVDQYLERTLAGIADDDKRQELRNVTAADAGQYLNISTASAGHNIVEIFGQPLLMKKVEKIGNSDFQIVPTKDVELRPLVLPVEEGNTYKDFFYTQESWGTEAKAPYIDNTPIEQRRLPYDGRKQEYLTISDFLEDYIIRVPHKMNNKDYYNPMSFSIIENFEEITYLLPLKEKFFEYFDASDLKDTESNNVVDIKIEKLAADSVLVILSIPVIGHGRLKTIKYQRRYSSGDPDIKRNKGGIETFEFDAFVMPLVKDKDESRSFYTVGCITTQSRNYTFRYFKGKYALTDVVVDCRNKNSEQTYKANTYTIEKSHFDYIQVSNEDGIKGLIIPKFKINSSAIIYSVSIDVGTSNTHIEYCKDSSKYSECLSYTEQMPLLSPVFIPTVSEIAGTQRSIGLQDEYELILRDFLPKTIGNGELFNFPTRTVLSCAKTFNPNQNNLPYGLFNMSFAYDKYANLEYNRDFCNIKWGREKGNTLLQHYINCVMLMVRNRILVGDGDLAKTKITWFFPTSMPWKRKNLLQRTWDECFDKYFGPGVTSSMTESSAPIRYLFDKLDTSTDVLSIDIGGGTTDIAFAKDKHILGVTSFRFASNTLFENQLAPGNQNNGIVDYFKQVLLDNIQNNGKIEEIKPLFDDETHQEPANMAAFLFSLKDNSYLKNMNKDAVDFNLILNKDENFKIVFIIFYTAILYHIGLIIKNKGYNLPRHISFSGNGSKILNVISTNTIDLANFTKLVLEEITGKKYSYRLELVGLGKDDNPKTSTCKGGLGTFASTLESDPTLIMRADGTDEIDRELTLENIKGDIDHQKTIISTVKDFFNFVLYRIPKTMKYNYDDHFGVTASSLEIARSIMNDDIDTFLNKGINLMVSEGEDKDRIEETLFFTPIKGVINAISKNIYDSLH